MTKQELIELARRQHAQVISQEKKSEQYQSDVEYYKFQIAQLKRLLYGAKRERFIPKNGPYQALLPFMVTEQPCVVEKEKIEYTRTKKKRENHPGRAALPSHLPVEEIIIEPEGDLADLKCIGNEITDELEYKPSVLYIKRYIRPKYVKENEDKTSAKILIADLPERPINKGIAGAGLLSQIMVDKYVDHLPIYRQIERFKRENVKINSSTVNNWQYQITKLLEPLYDRLKHLILQEGYLQVDETPTKVLDRDKKGKTHLGYYWVYNAPLQKSVFFDYQKGRGREGPKQLLEYFKGYMQTDGYVVYEEIGEREDITHIGCMAHARRWFEKALDNDKIRAEYVMTKIQDLYDIEREAKDRGLSPLERHELRLDKALPIANELGKYLAKELKEVLPKSAIGKALAYSVARWDKLLGYFHDGSLEIDNNWVENSIRPNALGRKNYLFAGSHAGAQRSAMMYTFFGTCKKQNVNPQKWLKKVLEIIPTYKISKLEDLLPQNLVLD